VDPLLISLLELLKEAEPAGWPLTVGGGLGLFLKRNEYERRGERTLFDRLPEVRATNDIDVFLRRTGG
jgi:hypothetical protein